MRLDRLLSIVMLLVNRKRIQARELADIFDVSVRTIYRDIDAINQAGIPVVSYQGASGGLGIAENYRIDRNVLSLDDIAAILSALKGLNTTLDDSRLTGTIEKIKGLIPDFKSSEYREKSSRIIIDLTPWGGNDAQKEKITLLKNAIESSTVVFFEYTCSKGNKLKREVEPVSLVLKMHTWYLYGFCRIRNAFRIFRLSRMKDLAVMDIKFSKRNLDIEEFPWEKDWTENSKITNVVLCFPPELRVIIEERFDATKISIDSKGYVRVRFSCPEDEWLYSMILSYGEYVEVIEPEHLRNTIKEKLRLMSEIYIN
ncbi:MAG: helix-turn-helix transcriptional regulator [Bacillota bacterium]